MATAPTIAPAPASQRDRSLAQILSLADAPRFAAETLAVFGLIWLWRYLSAAGLSGSAGMPHPYWLPVLLMSTQYGIMGGLFASLAATAAIFLEGLPSTSASSDFYVLAAQVTALPSAWFAGALVLGGLRTLHRHHLAAVQQELAHTTRLANTLADGVDQAVAQLGRLERRIATDAGTIGELLHGLAQLDLSSRAALLESMLDVIHRGTGAVSFAIYLHGESGLEPRAGMVDAVTVRAAGLPPLPVTPSHGGPDERSGAPGGSGAAETEAAPIWAPIGPPAGAPLGIVACSRLSAGQDPVAARRRLASLARLLARLLQACPAGTPSAAGL